MRGPGDGPGRVARAAAFVLALAVVQLGALPAFAVDVVTDGDMEAAGTGDWPLANLQGSNTAAKASDQSASGQSLKGVSQTGQRVDVEWTHTQSVGTVGATDTVLLSLWWGIRYSASTQAAQGDLFFEVRESGGAWSTVWTLATTPSLAFQSGTVSALDVSADFAATTTYEIRMRFLGRTGRDNAAFVEVWWDDVVLDVVGGASADSLAASANTAIETLDPSQGQAGIVMQRIQVDSDAAGNGQVELTSLSLEDRGTAVVGDIDTVRVYIDTDTGFAGAVEIGNAAFATDPVTVPLTLGTAAQRTVSNGTSKWLFVVYDLNAAATVGNDIQSRVTDVGVAAPDNGEAGLTFDSNTLTIQAPAPDTLTASANTAIETVDPSQGQGGIVMQRIQVDSDAAGNGQVELASLSLTDLGTAVVGDVDTVRVYIDTDTGFAGAVEIGSAAFATDPVTVPLTLGTAAQRTVSNGTSKWLFVVYDLNASATVGNTIQSRVTDVGVAAPDNGEAGLAFDSNTLTIQAPAPDTLTASANTPIETFDPVQGQGGIVMQRIQVDSDAAGNGQLELASLSLTDLGTAATADIDTVRVYVDTDNAFAGAVEIGNAAFATDPVTVSLTLGTAAQRTVTNGTSKWLFVVYDLNAAATVGSTIQSRVTAVGVTAPDNGASGLAFDSNALTIQAPAADATTVVSNGATPSSCSQLTVSSEFSGDANGNGSTAVEYNTSNSFPGTVACGAVIGPSPRVCLVTGLSGSTSYWLRITFSDPDGVSGANPQVIGPVSTPACGSGDDTAPTLLLLSPQRDAVVGGTDRFKVQVWDADALASPNPVLWSVDGGALGSAGVAVNANYDCGTGCAIYEFDVDTTALANGAHYVTVQASDDFGNVAQMDRPFRVANVGSKPAGSGRLLRRTRGSQLCIDCHNLATHSSQHTSTRYGNWAIDCLTCHTPHRTRNIFLIRESLQTPNSGIKTIDFRFDADSDLGYLGDTTGGSNAPYDDGICESCHTKTTHHRNDTSGGDHTHNVGGGKSCVECHFHDAGFTGGGGDCLGCHGDAGGAGTTGPNNRRPVNPDFANFTGGGQPRSHHVGAGATMGGALTAFDCVVCHAEGTANAGEVATTTFHQDGVIDLKDADDTTLTVVYNYDKAQIANDPGVAGPADWGSTTGIWRTMTSTQLDPFCLSCHDSDGATGTFNADEAGGSPSNPFADGTVTNNYDQVNRGGVVDIRSKVDDTQVPFEGQFSRHAIRGLAPSLYSLATLPDPDDTIYEGDPTAGESLFVQTGVVAPGEGDGITELWNDTSVMGCGDCHTVDGANGALGNAHGSDSEYLLKDAVGGATEGTLAGRSYVCYRCHKVGRYQEPSGPLGAHTGNGGDWQDKTALVGVARKDDGKGSNIFAMACSNCHGGLGFGSIHGTSDVIPIGADGGGVGGTPDRQARRFMNGASLRFFDPEGWTGTSITCYTLSKNTTPDAWGGCTQHGGGTGWTKPLQRPVSY